MWFWSPANCSNSSGIWVRMGAFHDSCWNVSNGCLCHLLKRENISSLQLLVVKDGNKELAVLTPSLTECENLEDRYQSHIPAMNAHSHTDNWEKTWYNSNVNMDPIAWAWLFHQLPSVHRQATGTRPAEKSLSCLTHVGALTWHHTQFILPLKDLWHSRTFSRDFCY